MSEQMYRALAEQMRIAKANAPDDETAATLDRAYTAYITSARHLKNAATREAAAVGARMAATAHFQRGDRVMSDHFDTMAEEYRAAADHLRTLAAIGAREAETHQAAALKPVAATAQEE